MRTAPVRTAIVLLNLGGPSCTEDIRPFLFNFFMDKNIIALPLPLRWLLAQWISWSRSRGAALEAYAQLGGKSPLLDNTRAQGEALEKRLLQEGVDARVFVSMRYWHPMAREVAEQIDAFKPERVMLLPLYPQYSTTTGFSSFEDWDRYGSLQNITEKICCYPTHEGFVRASAARIREELGKAPAGTRLLFSAHGLPQKVIDGGDPYQYQCEKSAEAIVRELAMPGLDWQICYQSRVGPLKWIGPSTIEALEKAGREGKGVVIYPHAFVSEHVETLVEIDIEYRHLAKSLNIPYFAKVETVGTHPDFIAGLATLVKGGEKTERFCPLAFSKCGCGQGAGT